MSGGLSYPEQNEPLPPHTSADRHAAKRPVKRHSFPVCPDCGGKKIHRSRPRGFLELAVLSLFFRPFRCEECDCRFLKPPSHFIFCLGRRFAAPGINFWLALSGVQEWP